ncbi:hypothetical protein MKX01_028853 [Papaver californicum]|nr:hypothetical protein MKX01_028853 [Papaver californicum]
MFSRETHLLVFIFVLVCCLVGVSKADGVFCDSSEVEEPIIVDPQPGQGNFSTVQEAVLSIPPGNTKWITIHLNPGLYREKVNITKDVSCIALEVENKDTTSIEWGDSMPNNSYDTYLSATFTSAVENFVAKSITFKNTYNFEEEGREVLRAVAAFISGDKSSFLDCGFIGVQDTLADAFGLHYFYNCYIEGAYDFIWATDNPYVMYSCEIMVREHPLPLASSGQGIINDDVGYITAQGRETEDQQTGFVLKNGKVNGAGNARTFLGRAWNDCSTVIYFGMHFSSDSVVQIVPARWDNWGTDISRGVYAEANNTGSGSEITGDVKWEKILSDTQIQAYTDLSFIDDGWLGKQLGDLVPSQLNCTPFILLIQIDVVVVTFFKFVTKFRSKINGQIMCKYL